MKEKKYWEVKKKKEKSLTGEDNHLSSSERMRKQTLIILSKGRGLQKKFKGK